MAKAFIQPNPPHAGAPSPRFASAVLPSERLLRAAVSGLIGLGAVACGDDDENADDHDHGELTDNELQALCQDMIDDAVEEATGSQDGDASCDDQIKTAEAECTDKLEKAETECTDKLEEKDTKHKALADQCAPWITLPEDKEISTEEKQYTFAKLTELCDEREGYTQIHGACGSVNSCQGFSYGDWGEDAVLTEHSCAGANGCTGLSCVVPVPEDTDRTGKEVWEAEFEEPGPGTCSGCHGGYYEDGKWVHDETYFAVMVLPGSTRTAENWLERSAAEQERVVAFGANYVLPGGPAMTTMSPYHRFLSRGEIERVVAHIRTLTPHVVEMKTQDP